MKTKSYKIEEIVSYVYNLNKSESLFLLKLSKNDILSVKEMSSIMKKDRTTSQKILSKLYRKNIIDKKQLNLDRGFMFVYFIKDKDKFWNTIKNSLIEELNIKMKLIDEHKIKNER